MNLNDTRYLLAGEVIVFDTPQKVQTILGSCVSVILWDSKAKMGGMNHFLLPHWDRKGEPTPRYGDVAITELHDRVLMHGAIKNRLVANVYGGANMLNFDNEALQIGNRNVELARKMLEDLGVPVKLKNTGGKVGRKIIFDPKLGIVKHLFLNG